MSADSKAQQGWASKYRETLRAMSDEAIAHQLAHGARGGIQREEIEAEAARRGVKV